MLRVVAKSGTNRLSPFRLPLLLLSLLASISAAALEPLIIVIPVEDPTYVVEPEAEEVLAVPAEPAATAPIPAVPPPVTVEVPVPAAPAAPAVEAVVTPTPTPTPLPEPVPAPASETAPPVAAPARPVAKGPLLSYSSPQTLRFSVYQRLAEAAQLAEVQAVPLEGRINLYTGISGLNRASIASLRISIDDKPLLERSLLATEIAALAERRSPLRLTRTTLTPGRHRVTATVVLAAEAGGKAGSSLKLDQTIEQGRTASDLELQVETGTIGKPTLALRRMQRDPTRRTSLVSGSLDAMGLSGGVLRYPPGSDADPALGHARTLARMGRPTDALLELLAEFAQAGPKAPFESPYWLEQATLLRQLGMLDRAVAICDQLDAAKVSAAEVAVERLLIAEARYQGGDYSAAERQLALSKLRLPEYRRADWRNVAGLVELARLQPGAATDTLKVANSESIEAFRYMAASTEALRATAYGRYNLAIAMIRSGDTAHGKSWLDLLGRTTPTDGELLELRDKANLALGWQFLRDRQGRTALGVLGRVRSDGLSSNRALLGMGWAQLAPNGERLPRVTLRNESPRAPDQLTDLPAPLRNSLARLKVLEPELTNKLGPVSFEREDPPKDPKEGLRRAIRIWSVLLERDERDPAVLEARLAIGHAQDQLGDIASARKTYTDAVDSLRGIDASIERDEAFVREGQLVATLSALDPEDGTALYGLMNRLRLEPGTDTRALYALIGDQREYRRLSTAVTNARAQTQALGSNDQTATIVDRLDIATRQLALVLRDAEKQVGGQALALLAARRGMVRDYMKTALLLAARADDTPSLQLRNSDDAGKP